MCILFYMDPALLLVPSTPHQNPFMLAIKLFLFQFLYSTHQLKRPIFSFSVLFSITVSSLFAPCSQKRNTAVISSPLNKRRNKCLCVFLCQNDSVMPSTGWMLCHLLKDRSMENPSTEVRICVFALPDYSSPVHRAGIVLPIRDFYCPSFSHLS